MERIGLILGGDPHIFTTGFGRQLLIQDSSFSCRLVHMENCINASANISPLVGLYKGYLKGTGNEMSPLRSQILLSPILFKEVTATKHPCSLDDFLVAKSSIKRMIKAL